MCNIKNFFDFIKFNFGFHACPLLKRYIKTYRTNIKIRIRIYFLKTCLKEDLIPNHMFKFIRNENNNLFRSSKERIDRLKRNFIFKYLRVELQDA